MAWGIEYYSQTVEQAVLRLPPGLLARYLRLTDLMREFGPNLGMPHTRAMGEGLFKLAPCGRTSSLDQCTPWFGHYILDSQLLA